MKLNSKAARARFREVQQVMTEHGQKFTCNLIDTPSSPNFRLAERWRTRLREILDQMGYPMGSCSVPFNYVDNLIAERVGTGNGDAYREIIKMRKALLGAAASGRWDRMPRIIKRYVEGKS